MNLDLGWNLPAPASKAEVLEALDYIRAAIEADDSFEGVFMYSMPTDEPWLYPAGTTFDEFGFPAEDARPTERFGLLARYRAGNSMGQGGMGVFTRPWPEGVPRIEQWRDRAPWLLARMRRALMRARLNEQGKFDRRHAHVAYCAAIDALNWALGARDELLGLTEKDANATVTE